MILTKFYPSPPLKFRLLYVTLALLGLPTFVVAQRSVLNFKALDVGSAPLSAADRSRFQSIPRNGLYKNLSIVSIGKLADLNGDTVSVVLPLEKTPLSIVSELVQQESDGTLMWGGRVLGKGGHMVIVESTEGTSGFLQVGTQFYDLLPAGKSAQFFGERDNKKMRPTKDVNSNAQALSTDPPRCEFPMGSNSYNTCQSVVSALVVVTPAAKTLILNLYGSIQSYMSSLRSTVIYALHNSDIPNKTIRLSWIEASLGLTGDVDIDRTLLPSLLGSHRANAQADVAFALTDIQAYQTAGVGGFVADIGLDNNKAYGVVQAQYGVSQYTFAHEFGHLMACRHNWPRDLGDDNTAVCAHGFRWFYRTDGMPLNPNQTNYVYSEATIVTVPVLFGAIYQWKNDLGVQYDISFQSDTRVLHYSNPTVDYNGYLTGRPASYIANNAYYLRNNMCTAAGFYNTPELIVGINLPPCNGSWPRTFTPNITTPPAGFPGQPPYIYQWHWSTNGIFPTSQFYSNLLSNSQTLSLSNAPICPVFWLRLNVISSDGVALNKIVKVDLSSGSCNCMGPGFSQQATEERSQKSQQSGKPSIWPNPVNYGHAYNVWVPELAHQTVPYTLSDALGRTIRTRLITFDAEGTAHIPSADNVQVGLHFLRLHPDKKQPITLKFIIQ